MTEALAERPTMPKDQLDLIRRTVASGATNDELALFLYDCQRRGIHPLDKLLHFTKRGGRYTPVTSIDFMRSQAAMTGEMAGSDDPLFSDGDGVWTSLPRAQPVAAMVTVYRLTQGQRFAYTATARWSEYCPDNAPMWKRMPHTMLGKCAEALALRKAFPQQLAGLYSREEMDQADSPSGFVVTAPAPPALAIPAGGEERENPAAVTGEAHGTSDLDGLLVVRVEHRATKNPNVTKHIVVLSDGRETTTIKDQMAALADELCQTRALVVVETKDTKWGVDLVSLRRGEESDQALDAEIATIDDKDLPF